MPYHVTKHYPHSLGLSACFRQWRAKSHCSLLHGYALAFTFEFEAEDLNECNWVIDFGGLKPIKEWLVRMFDHTMLVAHDDPLVEVFKALAHQHAVADMRRVENTGCEAFAKLAFGFAKRLIDTEALSPRVRLVRVTVAEHEGNSASYSGPSV